MEKKKGLSICLVSDFFYPGFGGVESHIMNLAFHLICNGNKVIVITKAVGNRRGIRFIRVPDKIFSKEPDDEKRSPLQDHEDCQYNNIDPVSKTTTTNVENSNMKKVLLSCFLKVYYIPIFTLNTPNGVTTSPLSLGLTGFQLYRDIFLRETVNLVHGHQSSSAMASNGIVVASTMGIPTVFTDHSLFGFGDSAAIHLNMGLKISINCCVDQLIAVSYIGKQNIILRTELPQCKLGSVSVIPNAVDVEAFRPRESKYRENQYFEKEIAACRIRNDMEENPKGEIVIIVVVTRFVYRKGIHLLKEVFPRICEMYPSVYFLIGGDGDLRYLLEEQVERYNLYDRVKLIGQVPSDQVREILIQGDIFLNCSLTEAFGISILEAASCGLKVVSTRVGGIPEILPEHMMTLAEPTVEALTNGLSVAIQDFLSAKTSVITARKWSFDDISKKSAEVQRLQEYHEQVKRMYNWRSICLRTEAVYLKAILEMDRKKNIHRRLPDDSVKRNERSSFLNDNISITLLLNKIENSLQCGVIFGKILCLLMVLYHLLYCFCEWWFPRKDIDLALSPLEYSELQDYD